MISFLKEEKFGLREQSTFIGKKCDIYLPKEFFEGDNLAFAKIIGDKVETLGIFWFQVDEKDWYEFQLPIKFMFQFSEKETKKNLAIKPGMPKKDYEVFSLNRNDAFIWDTNNKKDALQLKDFFQKILEGGKIPNNVPYEEVYGVLLNALSSTEVFGGLGVSSVALEFLVSELYREKANTNLPFRLAYNGESTSYKYKAIRITLLTRFGQFTSIIGEDIQTGLMGAILKTRTKQADIVSPLEKLLKY